jgi:hypothetical protein
VFAKQEYLLLKRNLLLQRNLSSPGKNRWQSVSHRCLWQGSRVMPRWYVIGAGLCLAVLTMMYRMSTRMKTKTMLRRPRRWRSYLKLLSGRYVSKINAPDVLLLTYIAIDYQQMQHLTTTDEHSASAKAKGKAKAVTRCSCV